MRRAGRDALAAVTFDANGTFAAHQRRRTGEWSAFSGSGLDRRGDGEAGMAHGFCGACGAALNKGAAFCGACGAPAAAAVQVAAPAPPHHGSPEMAQRMSWKKGLGIAFGVTGLLLLLIFGGVWLDHRLNYAVVSAQVISVENLCVMTRSRRRQSTVEHGPMHCEEANRRRQSGSYPDFSVRELTILRVSYLSPADNRQHETEMRTGRNAYASVSPGSTIEIRAHKSRPDTALPAVAW